MDLICDYVSALGIKNTCDLQFLNREVLESSDFAFPTIHLKTIVVYVQADMLGLFCKKAHAELKRRIVLVSGDEDSTVPGDVFQSSCDLDLFLDNKNVVKWFAQNYSKTITFSHPKIVHIPLGLPYNSFKEPWIDIDIDVTLNALEQEHQLNDVRKKYAKILNDRKLEIYCTFHFQTNGRYALVDRVEATNQIPKHLVFYEFFPITRLNSWIKQCQFAFVACPHGNGLDTHRFWEALLLGCIPIIKTSGMDELFNKLPVLIVRSWSDLNEPLLRKTVAKIVARSKEERSCGDEKLLLKFWEKEIEKCL